MPSLKKLKLDYLGELINNEIKEIIQSLNCAQRDIDENSQFYLNQEDAYFHAMTGWTARLMILKELALEKGIEITQIQDVDNFISLMSANYYHD